jgi:MOSC domain-containing protein YiiM
VLLSVNLATETLPTPHDTGRTGIGKHPVAWPVPVCDPGPKRRGHPRPNGLAGDIVCTTEHHGGTDQAVYAYAREDLDWWERELGYELPAGRFGENLTTQGLDLTSTLVGEPKWVKRFAARGATGTYLRVVVPGEIKAGDRIEVIRRPRHTVTIGRSFRALTTEAELLPSLLEAGDDLPPEERATVLRRTG